MLVPKVASARLWAIRELRNARIECPETAADTLLGFVLGWDRVRVLSRCEQDLDEKTWRQFQELVGRHRAGEPLQHLTGEREFYGLAFYVNSEVLIPRPETEILVEEALKLMQAMPEVESRFVDVGTGSGCIAVSIVHEMPSATGWGTDISLAALQVAQKNAVRHGVDQRLQFIQADLVECFPGTPIFDFVLSNPPYVAAQDYDRLPPMVRDHEPSRALLGGTDGLEVYGQLIPAASARLKPGGYMLLELGAGQEKQVARMIQDCGLSLQSLVKDLRGISRCLIARKIPE